MAHCQFAEHPLHHAREVLPHADIRQKDFVFGLHRSPVVAVHVRVVEIIAVDAPRLVEHLPPLGHRIDLHRDLVERQFVFGGIDLFADVGDRPGVLDLQQDALAVAGELEAVDFLHQRVLFALAQAVMR